VQHAITDEGQRALARAQLDALVAKLYGITREELAYILEKFPLVDKKQKDLVLANLWDVAPLYVKHLNIAAKTPLWLKNTRNIGQ